LLEPRNRHRIFDAQLLLQRLPDLFVVLLFQPCRHAPLLSFFRPSEWVDLQPVYRFGRGLAVQSSWLLLLLRGQLSPTLLADAQPARAVLLEAHARNSAGWANQRN